MCGRAGGGMRTELRKMRNVKGSLKWFRGYVMSTEVM